MKVVIKKSVYTLLFISCLFISCNSDDDLTEQENKGVLTSLVFEASKNNLLKNDIEANIDFSKKEISVTLPFGVDIEDLAPTIISIDGTTAEFTPNFGSLLLRNSEGFLEETYNVLVKNGQNTESILKSFVFETADNPELKEKVIGKIDENAKTVTLTLAKGTDVTALTPTVTISENATITPEGKQDFSKEIEYKITSEDGKSINTYKVVINYVNNTEATLEKLSFLASENSSLNNDIEGILYKFGQKNIIVANLDFTTNVTSLIPNISVSSGATINISGAQDFSKTVVYKITSEDGKKEKIYHVVTANPDKAALIAIYDANYTGLPDMMALTWDITEPDLEKWKGVELNNEKRVSDLTFSLTRINTLPEELGNLTELTSFQLSGFTNPDLPKSFKNLQKITFLNFRTNDDQNTGWESIPSQIFQLKELSILTIDNHRITEIPDDIIKLNKLRFITIGYNKAKIATISTEIEKIEKLISLNLTNNKKEMLPDNICELKNNNESLIKIDSNICN